MITTRIAKPRLTVAAARKRLGALGMSLRNVQGDWRVTFRPPPGATKAQLERLEQLAAYCPDLEEALLTGAAMHAHRARHPQHYADLGTSK